MPNKHLRIPDNLSKAELRRAILVAKVNYQPRGELVVVKARAIARWLSKGYGWHVSAESVMALHGFVMDYPHADTPAHKAYQKLTPLVEDHFGLDS